MPPASPRISLLSATSLATAVASLAAPADAAFFTFSEKSANAFFTAAGNGGIFDVGHNSDVGSKTGYTLLSPGVTGPGPSVRAQNIQGSKLSITSSTTGWISLTSVNNTLDNKQNDNFNILVDTTKGQTVGSASATFTYTGTTSGGTSETNTLTVRTTFVAPVATQTTNATVFVLPGASATQSFVIQNVGDGNKAGADDVATGGVFASNLRGASTVTNGSGWAGTVAATNLTDGTSATSTFTYTGGASRTASATASIVTSFTNGSTAKTGAAQTITTTLTGITVAPVASVTSSVSFAPVRAGASATQSLTVKNIGDGNLAGTTSTYNLRGSVGAASGAFSGAGGQLNGTTGLKDSNGGGATSASYTFTYAPVARGTHNATVTTTLDNGADSANKGGTASTALSGTAVGPVYDAKLDSTAIGNGATVSFAAGGASLQYKDLMVSNVTSDTPAGTLTDLSLTVEIINDPLNEFQLSLNGGGYGHTASFVSAAGGLAAAIANISLQFNSKVSGGDGSAQLRIATDEGAAFGGAGAIYIYNLAAIPEPGTLVVVGAGLLGLAVLRRRPRAPSPAQTAHAEPKQAAPTGM